MGVLDFLNVDLQEIKVNKRWILILKIAKMISLYINKKKENKRNVRIRKYSLMANQCGQAITELIPSQPFYICNQFKNSWINKYADIYKEVRKAKRIDLPSEKIRIINSFITVYRDADNTCYLCNKRFIEIEKENNKYLFENIEGKALDDQQQECIIKDEVNNLVIAGAGSGKTTTIVGKVKYLLERYSYDPEKILVLSFTNVSAKEMSARIKKETCKDIDVMTFHKLGLDIITDVEEAKPSLTAIELLKYVNEQFNILTKNPDYNYKVSKYFLSYLKLYKSRFDFRNKGDYLDYLKDANISTLKNQIVKSYEEMEIANFLLINNIKYEYESKYELDTRSKKFRQYIPDFYLPDYSIYIEHFGIDRKGNVPRFFEGKKGLTPKKVYNKSIAWKRQLHKNNNTVLIETFSYEKAEGVLLDNLKKKLEVAGVEFNPMTSEEIWALIENDKNNYITNFVNLMSTFIVLLKSNNFNIDKIKQINRRLGNVFERARNEAFINLVVPIYTSYEEKLKKDGDIDFNDMINKATEYVQQNRYKKAYTYIIVDEFQDISQTRYSLIKAIKDSNNAKIFCVGDDWQSIYRFAGSNIDFITSFEKYFGYTQKSYIETTYRFNKNLIELSSNFILKDKSQIIKQLKSYIDDESTAFELVYGNSSGELCSKLKQKLNYLPHNASVAFIGRYKGDLEQYIDNEITSRFNFHTRKLTVYYSKRKDLKIEYMTVHKSKGLQAEYVFILNNTNRKYGFPSQIEDDPVLKLFSQNIEDFPFAEERRLFYVALTRARKSVYLMVENGCKSSFIREIEADYNLADPLGESVYCPECKKGILELKSGPYSDFYGCSNYPLCKYRKKVVERKKYYGQT